MQTGRPILVKMFCSYSHTLFLMSEIFQLDKLPDRETYLSNLFLALALPPLGLSVFTGTTRCTSRTLFPEILATCRQFYDEVKHILYDNRFLLPRDPLFSYLPNGQSLSTEPYKMLDANTISHITHLVFDYDLVAKTFVVGPGPWVTAEHLKMKRKRLSDLFVGDTAVTCIVALKTLSAPTHRKASWPAPSYGWRNSIKAFQERRPPLKKIEYWFHPPLNELNPVPMRGNPDDTTPWERSAKKILGAYDAWLGQPYQGVNPQQQSSQLNAVLPAVQDGDDIAARPLKVGFDAENGCIFHADSKWPLPLKFTLHQHRVRMVREWLSHKPIASNLKYNSSGSGYFQPVDSQWADGADELDYWDYSFQTRTRFQHRSQVRVHMTLVSTPSTHALCQIVGDWGHMSRMEALELAKPGKKDFYWNLSILGVLCAGVLTPVCEK
ncbi:hypothetical protein BT63DRAFT_417212 [Microthyrium microscopicum]|uniref:Uncharacterized protein n=1 Tax=Microthyrium microscopicum TaxID=703497 RepID=A0A6A6U243_9PEZI|nr:hypothetical protein BT63DRAFT_417212 [Microthyrium microscopicum]